MPLPFSIVHLHVGMLAHVLRWSNALSSTCSDDHSKLEVPPVLIIQNFMSPQHRLNCIHENENVGRLRYKDFLFISSYSHPTMYMMKGEYIVGMGKDINSPLFNLTLYTRKGVGGDTKFSSISSPTSTQLYTSSHPHFPTPNLAWGWDYF